MLCIWKISLASWCNTWDEPVSVGKLTAFAIIQWEEMEVPSLFLAMDVFAPINRAVPCLSVCHRHLAQMHGVVVVISAGLGVCEISCFPLKIHAEDSKLWIVPSVLSDKCNCFQTTNIGPQAPGTKEGISPWKHTHTHILDHKECSPQVKKGPQMGQYSVPRWYTESSLPKSCLACLVHGLRSCWFPDFGVGQVFSMRSDCKRQDPTPSSAPQKVEILLGSFVLILINQFPANVGISSYIFCSLSVIQEVKWDNLVVSFVLEPYRTVK